MIWFRFLCILLINFIPKTLCADVVDPFDMRDYDPKTKSMRTTAGNSLIDTQKCSEWLKSIQQFCSPNFAKRATEDKHCAQNSEHLRHSADAATLKMFMMRFLNILLNKNGMRETGTWKSEYEYVMSITLTPHQLNILNDFGETGNTAHLPDIDEILSSQTKPYYPPMCADDYFQKFYSAKEFFSQSTFIILGILAVAAVFFYNVVMHRIRIAFLSLFATIFFAGFFWTYWRLYEETMSDMMRVSETYDHRECLPRQETFMWFFSYTIPADHKICKEIYDAANVRPLAKLTPTIVFYETIKIFWSGVLNEMGAIVITLFKQIMDYSPWYIKWTVLPLIFIFLAVFIIICCAFLAGKRFKLSHPIFGAIELDNDVNPPVKSIASENTIKIIKNSNGSDSGLSCLTCGTTFVQTAVATAQIITKTVIERGENTDPNGRLRATDTTDSGPGMNSLGYFTNFVRSIAAPLLRLRGVDDMISDSSPPPPEEFEYNEPGEELTEKYEGFPNLEDCSDSDSENKENRIVSLVNNPNSEFGILECAYERQEPLYSVTNFSVKSSGPSPVKSTKTESKKKYFEDVKFTKSPDPNEKRMIPTIVSEPSTSHGGAGEPAETNLIDRPFQENSESEKYFSRTNEKIKKQLHFQQVSAKLYSSGKKVSDVDVQIRRRFWSSGKRKLSF